MPSVKGARRKTTAALALSGALERNPKRYASVEYEPKPTKPLGAAPKYFTEEQKKIWKEVAAQCAPDVLFGSDRITLELITTLISKLRSGTIKALEQNLLLTCLQQLGMTPLARTRIAVTPNKDKSKSGWGNLLNPPIITAQVIPNES